MHGWLLMAEYNLKAASITLTDDDGRETVLDLATAAGDMEFTPSDRGSIREFIEGTGYYTLGVDYGSKPSRWGVSLVTADQTAPTGPFTYRTVYFDEPPHDGDEPVQRIDTPWTKTIAVHTTGFQAAGWLKRWLHPEKYRRDLRRRATRKRGQARRRKRGWR